MAPATTRAVRGGVRLRGLSFRTDGVADHRGRRRRLAAAACAIGLSGAAAGVGAAELVEVGVVDRDFLVVHVSDGEVIHHEGASAKTIVRYLPELDTGVAVQNGSLDDHLGRGPELRRRRAAPARRARKTKLSGHAQMEWIGSDFRYEYTYEHWIYLKLPELDAAGDDLHPRHRPGHEHRRRVRGRSSSTSTAAARKRCTSTWSAMPRMRPTRPPISITGWATAAPATTPASRATRSRSTTSTRARRRRSARWPSGWPSGSDVFGYNLTRSDVWNVDFSGLRRPRHLPAGGRGRRLQPGLRDRRRRLRDAVRGLGARLLLHADRRGNPDGIVAAAADAALHPRRRARRRPRSTSRPCSPGTPSGTPSPAATGGTGPNDWAPYRKPGNPTNPNAWGGHSDAADWDRHLGHVVNIYDMLLPFLMTDGAISDDDTGITRERQRHPRPPRRGPQRGRLLAAAARRRRLLARSDQPQRQQRALPGRADGHRRLGQRRQRRHARRRLPRRRADEPDEHYRDEAVAAYDYADGLADPMLDEGIERRRRARPRPRPQDDGRRLSLQRHRRHRRGRTSSTPRASAPAARRRINNLDRNQIWATAAYLITPQTVHYPALRDNMKTAIIDEARSEEADLIDSRPSRRATDQVPAYFGAPAQNVDRTIIAHAVADDPGGHGPLPQGARPRGRLGPRPESDEHDPDDDGSHAARVQAQRARGLHLGEGRRRAGRPPGPHAVHEPRRLGLGDGDGTAVGAVREQLSRRRPEHLADRRGATSRPAGCGRTPSSRRARPCAARWRSTATSTGWPEQRRRRSDPRRHQLERRRRQPARSPRRRPASTAAPTAARPTPTGRSSR